MASLGHEPSILRCYMGVKLWEIRPGMMGFHCPGCNYGHWFKFGSTEKPNWDWNGSIDKPTVSPSIDVLRDYPDRRCHSFVVDGKIQFLSDSWHSLKGQTVEIPDELE